MPTAIRLVFCLFMLIVCLALSISIIQLWLSLKYHLFSHEYIAQVTKNHVGEKPEQAFAGIIKDLEDEYPGHILPQTDRQWIFMNCGGWMGRRYWANISDTILNGTFRQWKEGEIESQMFYPGDTVYHDIGEAAAVDWTPGTWMVEYGRGFVPSTLGFALADTFFSTQDFVTLYYVLRVYCKALILEATTSIVDLIT